MKCKSLIKYGREQILQAFRLPDLPPMQTFRIITDELV